MNMNRAMSMNRAQRTVEAEEWLTVQDACSLLGVSPATLRRWSAAGDVQAFTTPGGHRRYARSTILGLLPDAGRGRPTLAELGVSAERMTRAYRRNMPQATRGVGWISRLDDEESVTLRGHGGRILAALLVAIDAESPTRRDRALAEATSAAAAYGRLAAGAGGDVAETVESFFRFRLLFVDELVQVARRQGLDTGESTRLVLDAVALADRLLPAVLSGFAA